MHWGSLPKLLHEEVLLEFSETRLVSLGIIRLVYLGSSLEKLAQEKTRPKRGSDRIYSYCFRGIYEQSETMDEGYIVKTSY